MKRIILIKLMLRDKQGTSISRSDTFEVSTGRQRHACISAARGLYGQFWRIIHACDLCHNRRVDNFA